MPNAVADQLVRESLQQDNANAVTDQLIRESLQADNANAVCDGLYREAIVSLCLPPSQPSTFNYVKTFEQDNGTVNTLALDGGGTLWEESVGTQPQVLNPLATNILPNTFADSTTQSNEEWICFSDLQKGTDIPRHGSNLDRISQVGPGAGPAVVGAVGGTNVYNIVASPSGLTQPTAKSNPANPGHFDDINWANGPTGRSPGNVLTIFYTQISNAQDPDLQVGRAVYLNLTSAPFTGLTGTYIITAIGQAFPSGSAGAARWYFSVQVNTTGNTLVGGATPTGSYQVTLATLTTTAPAAINVNNTVTLAGVTAPAWDGAWTILATLNSGQYQITATSLTSNVATYNYTAIGGSPAIAAGNQITVSGCTNGPIVNGTSIFNVTNYDVASATGTQFTLLLNGANVTSAAENANAISSGTKFQFDPGLSNLGVGVNPIYGNSGGGTVTTSGNLGSGTRQAVTIFVTRNGYQTAPSPPVLFETTGSTNNLQVGQIALGPPNVIARIVAFTGANGGNFFWIPEPVTIQGAGQPVTYSATIITDNVTTSATFQFTDAVLLAATAIDIQGNDLFNQIELGASTWDIAYASRMFYGGENNKIQNLLNTTFDGGYLPNQNGVQAPLGWAVDPTNGIGGSVVASPIFGNSYYVQNTTGSTQSVLGLITQSAFQDVYKVPIILPSFTYSVRLRASCPSGLTTGSLVIDLYSPSLARTFGSYTLPISSMTTSLTLFSGELLSTAFTTSVQSDLQLRVWASGLANNADVLLDRFEVYPDNEPVLRTELQGSYIDNLEAFDGVTGPLGVGAQNNQPALGGFINYDILYILKSNSMVSTQDSPGNEPAQWTVREVSNKVGTAGIHAYDYGEEWAVTAHRSGLWIYNGSEPVKISQEIQPTWDAINWTYGYTIWVRNDTVNRRILVGVPMATPNKYLPNAPVNANPTTPNVILMLNYKELNTSSELAQRGPLKIAYSGKLISWDISRKWSIWQIPATYADFIKRPDTSAPLFFCQANSTITQQVAGLLNDNGAAIDALYTTYGFVKSEQEPQFGPLLGDHRKLATYMVMNAQGTGNMTVRVIPNQLASTSQWTVPGGVPLVTPENNNLENPLEISGDRLYVQFETSASTASFQISELKMTLQKEPNAPVTGL
jgi:hypothetical protein